ncbi:hypothetical protein [Pediococcus pentosaceus]|uniref:hypothetical protein n=1 Tax=Pediococcus pentosaceus TaxID=1255 RepID=UPI0039867918
MKIAATSDNHFDVNKIDENQMAQNQAEYLLKQHVGVYLINLIEACSTWKSYRN